MDVLASLLIPARAEMAAFFANPPEGLCSGKGLHERVLATLDRVIEGGESAPDETRRTATFESRRWMGKIAADLPENDEKRGLILGWQDRMRAFPTRW